MLGRRLLVLMAVLLGLTALATALAPRPTVSPRPGAATASPTPRPSAESQEGSASRVVAETVDAGREDTAPVRARTGDTVRLVVQGDVLDAVEIEGLDEIEPIEPGSPARFEFRAEAPGRHAILLQAADRRVGLLDIRPGPGG